MSDQDDKEEALLRSVAIQNATSILLARQRTEDELRFAKEELERKTRQLANSLSAMRATLESTADGILVTDSAGCITACNEKYVAMWRLEAAPVEGDDHRQLLHSIGRQFSDRSQFMERVEEICASSSADSFDVLELADGRVFERVSKIQRINEAQAGRVWSFRDITEHRRVQDALRDETRVLELLNQTGAAISSQLDLEVLLQLVTDAATQLSEARFGVFFHTVTARSGEVTVLHTLSGVPRDAPVKIVDPRATALFGPTFRGAPPIRCDDVLLDPRYANMEVHWGLPLGSVTVRSYQAVPVVSRTGEIIGGLFFADPEVGRFSARTERIIVGVAAQAAVAIDNARLYEAAQRAADEREKLLGMEHAARQRAENLSALKDEFLATLSHELRTPLSAILGWSHLLRSRDAGRADLHKGLETIERSARLQTQLIDDLLDMSRITAGKIRLDVQSVDPTAIIEAALETVRPAADAKQIRLQKFLDPAAGPIVGDPARLQQVIWNLLSNSIKFTPKQGKVQILLERVNSHIEIVVADTGSGITPDFIDHVFERFRQADATITRRHGGLGLGLAIVKQLVELHGGSVRAASPGEGLGATFTVNLPLTVVRRSAEPETRVHPATSQVASVGYSPVDLTGVKVLVVDDEPDARELVEQVLSGCNAQVATASNADEALSLLATHRPDVLISDIGMPDVDGYELLRRARALGPAAGGAVAAIALSAFARSEDRTRALRAGFLVHVAKPADPSELIATVASVAGRTKP